MYAPTLEFQLRNDDKELLALALHHQFVQEAVISFTLCSVLDCSDATTYSGNEALRHRGNTLRGLRLRLKSHDCADNASVYATMLLVSVDVSYLLIQ